MKTKALALMDQILVAALPRWFTPTPTTRARREITAYARTPLAWRLNNDSDNPRWERAGVRVQR